MIKILCITVDGDLIVCDISFLVVTPVILINKVYKALEGRVVAMQMTEMTVLTVVSLS